MAAVVQSLGSKDRNHGKDDGMGELDEKVEDNYILPWAVEEEEEEVAVAEVDNRHEHDHLLGVAPVVAEEDYNCNGHY